MELQKELRLGNLVLDRGTPTILKPSQLVNLIQDIATYESIPLTKENIEKYIDWSFEKGFNKTEKTDLFYHMTEYLLENIIDGSSSFEIVYSEHLVDPSLFQITYYIDDKLLEFGLDDTLHNLQNLFFISSGQELPINKY